MVVEERKVELARRAWNADLEELLNSYENKNLALQSADYYRKRIAIHERANRSCPALLDYTGRGYPLYALEFDKKLLASCESEQGR